MEAKHFFEPDQFQVVRAFCIDLWQPFSGAWWLVSVFWRRVSASRTLLPGDKFLRLVFLESHDDQE